MPIPVVAPLTPITVDGWDVVTLTATATNTPTSWSWTADGGVALTGTGASRTFTAPALWNGSTVTVTVTATNGSGTSAPVTGTVTVRDWNSFVLTHLGTWTPRRPFARIPIPVNVYTGGVAGSSYPNIYSGGIVGSTLPDVYTGGAVLVITTRTGVAHLTGTGGLQASSTSGRVGTATLAGTGVLTAFTGSKKVGNANLTGSGLFTASGSVPPPPPPPPPPGNVKYSVADVTNNIGTVTHCSYAIYANQESGWLAALNDIGIKHIRDRVGADTSRVLPKIHGNGVKATLVLGAPWGLGFQTNVTTAIGIVKSNLQASWLDALEGPNEPDAFGGTAAQTHTWMNQMYPAIRGDSFFNGVPVKSPAWAFPSGLASYGHDTMEDITNMHTYMSGDIPESGKLATWISEAQAVYGTTNPMSVTEWGYHTDTSSTAYVDEQTQADYHIRAVFWFILHGVEQASVYEFLDDPNAAAGRESHFGIVRSNLSYKPVATALKNLLSRMVDNGTGQLITSFPYSWTASTSDVKVVPLGRRDGKIDFAVWRATAVYNFSSNTRITVSPATVSFSLTTAAPVSAFKVGTGVLSTVSSSTKSFTVAADGSVLLVRVG